MSALTATPPNLVDDVEPTPRAELVLESAPSAAKSMSGPLRGSPLNMRSS